ncbi:ligand-dependent corepressor [Kryptolebias marmoratus]|uniref:Ligand dependent nuclear receptor corepressor n=1 Tax=Kryptolebias marmoratus TaxID=37003 RepID=A0A3Q2ZWJ6_KRYMA|nr:ligand-dependent corepressor [Kryptolebias marmoratus]
MASLCKRQQCTIERRGFRQELDSWRHKLIHCVGFESILEGLFGPGLVKDITLFQDCEPQEVSDWSFDENCLFCCLRREKTKEHSVENGGHSHVLSECEDFKQGQSRISRLERQARDFLNAVFHRKDLPSFSDPHIPLVAREIMQRMIHQFAAEYTSKTTQDDPPLPNGTMKDQSLPRAASLAPAPSSPAGPAPSSPPSSASSSPSPTPGAGFSPTSAAATSAPACIQSSNGMGASNGGGGGGTAAASAQNPVLSKLLMADQDSPLDLTVKKNQTDPEPSQQDGVLDLSTKKNNNNGGSPKTLLSFTPAPGAKGHSLKSEHNLSEVEEEDGLLQKRLQDGLRENYVNSNSFKTPLARSLRIKEELLSQKHRLLSQPTALSLANLESAGLLNHGQSHSMLSHKGSSSFWGSKAHLESLMKLKQAGGALSDLKDLPTFLENHHHNHHGAFSYKSSLHHHSHHQVSKAQHHHNEGKREQGYSPPVDLKIPQVRGMDLSWDSHSSELYGYGTMGVGGGGHGENTLSRKLRAILPKQNRRGGSLGSLLDGATDYWSSDLDHSSSGPAYSISDVEGDPNSKQPRKKRGRYRQYNSEILEEAIAVVMSGKMSVSKAQNMYGIPHSTLEYKVKERMGTLKNPPKKKLKLMMKVDAGGQDFATESENTPTTTPRDDGLPLAAAELKDNVKEEEDDNIKPSD